MANHKSAKKRSRQTVKRNQVNSQVLSNIKTNINKFTELLKVKNKEDLDKSLSSINSSLAKASKRGLIKKEYVSRKLSSLSKKIKNI
jgi:small subunit ribosomal protein S20